MTSTDIQEHNGLCGSFLNPPGGRATVRNRFQIFVNSANQLLRGDGPGPLAERERSNTQAGTPMKTGISLEEEGL